jgi:Cu+-exporting ATPase
LLVDKTGTLTEGKPVLSRVTTENGFEEKELLDLVAALERHSEHPLGTAIQAAAVEATVADYAVEDFEAHTGLGVSGLVSGRPVLAGNCKLLERAGIETSPFAAAADGSATKGATVIWAAVDGQLAGILAVSDPVKESTPDAIAELHAEGVNIVMVTGDNAATAKVVAAELGINDVHAGVLPEQKLELVHTFQASGHRVAMAGDGINDSPALAAADVGIAMGTGTDVAMESAGITLVKGDLRGIARARRLSHLTMNNIRQNLFFAFFYNCVGVPVAAGILYPFIGLLLNPMIAAAAMSFSSVSVISNALRLRTVKL